MSRPAAVTGIVLAGGRSSRFGADKLAAKLDGAAVLVHSIERLAVVVDELVVAGPARSETPAAVGSVEVRFVPDARPLAGPLVALAGALAVARGAIAIVVGGDMPDLVPAVLRSMVGRLEADPATAAVTLESTSPKRQVLPVAVRVAGALEAAAAAVDAGDRSLVRLLDRLAGVQIPLDDWRPLDPDGRTLRDVDTTADLDALRHPGMR